jgi:glycosyltransferase involved in cell wall biosynthesis
MRILIYSHAFAPMIGGVETYSMLLAQGLAAGTEGMPAEVCCVTPAARGNFDDAALPFAVVRRPGIRRLFRLIREADIVHLAGPAMLPLFLAILLRKPVVVEHHAYQAICPNGLLLYAPTRTACPDCFMRRRYLQCLRCNAGNEGWLGSARMLVLSWPRRWLCRLASAHLCITRHVARRVRLPRSTVIHYGVPEVEAVESAPLRQDPPAKPSTLTVGYVGRLVQEKDVPTLIEAVRQVRVRGDEIALTIIGDGPERKRLEDLATRAGFETNAVFTGALCGPQLHSAAQNVDVLVLPSRWEEPAGLVVMEQMMRGRPVVVTDNGGAAELAGDAGLSFPPGDTAALAQCMRRFTDEPELLATLGERARNKALDLFSQQCMVENHYNLFQVLLEAHRAKQTGGSIAGHEQVCVSFEGTILRRRRNLP